MKKEFIIILTLGLFTCNQPSHQSQVLEKRIDSLEKLLSNTYKPGFGEFMSSIQAHHAKLWFAGINENWKLAEFEVHEIMETMENIQKYQTEREESESIGIITPALDSINSAIAKKDITQFKASYSILTNTCNKCHEVTNFEYNMVKIPETPFFSNQDFSIKK